MEALIGVDNPENGFMSGLELDLQWTIHERLEDMTSFADQVCNNVNSFIFTPSDLWLVLLLKNPNGTDGKIWSLAEASNEF